MNLSFNEEITFSVRCEIDLLNKYFFYGTEEGFEHDIPEDAEYPMREIRIYIYDRNNGKPVAFIKLYLMESYYVVYGGSDVLSVADSFNDDTCSGFEILMNNRIVQDKYEEYMDSIRDERHCSSGILQNLYVYPEYRQNGIGKFLLENLNDIMVRFFDMDLLVLSTYLNPFHNDEINAGYAKHPERELTDSEEKMLEGMRKFVKKLGFKKVRGKKDYYLYFVRGVHWTQS